MFGLPFFLLNNRKKKWNTLIFKKGIFIGLLTIGVSGFSIFTTTDYRLFFYSLITTSIYLIVESFFKYLSQKKHNRDINLWLNYSDDVDGIFAPMKKNEKFKTTDILFSITLLILIALLSVLGSALFGKDNLFDKIIN
jgi:hypothetical protein